MRKMSGIKRVLQGFGVSTLVAGLVGCAAADDAQEPLGEESQPLVAAAVVPNPAATGVVGIYRNSNLVAAGVVLPGGWVVTSSTVVSSFARPASLKARLGNKGDAAAEERAVVAAYLHPNAAAANPVRLAVLRLASPFSSAGPSFSDVGAVLDNAKVTCFGYDEYQGIPSGTLTSRRGTTGRMLSIRLVEGDAGAVATPKDFGGPCLLNGKVVALMTQESAKQRTILVTPNQFSSWATTTRTTCAQQDPRSKDFCSDVCPCVYGESDCDRDSQCASGLVCAQGSGPAFGYFSGDACVKPECERGTPGDSDYCTNACPCGYGGGRCSDSSQCQNGFQCRSSVGQAFGGAYGSKVCLPDTCATTSVGSDTFCSEACPCGNGGGDCDSDDDCLRGLVCRHNVGASFGMSSTSSVCLPPTCQTQPKASPDFCSSSCPCGYGGECESDAECRSGLQCFSGLCKFPVREPGGI